MTPEQRAGIERKHGRGARAMDGVPVCVWCRQLWPCHTEQMSAALAEAEQEIERLKDAIRNPITLDAARGPRP